MSTIAAVSIELVAVVAVMGLIQFLLLAFRNPHRSPWLRGSGVESVAATGIVAVICFALAFLIAGLTGVGMDAFLAMILAMAVAGVSAFAIWRLFRVGERLRRAEAGQSPFGPMAHGQPGGKPGQIGGKPVS